MWILFLYPSIPTFPPCPSLCNSSFIPPSLYHQTWCDSQRRKVELQASPGWTRSLIWPAWNEVKINSGTSRTSEMEISLKALSKTRPRQQKRSASTTYPFTIVTLAPRAPPAASAQRRARLHLVSPGDVRRISNRCASPPTCSHFFLLGGRLDRGQLILCIVQTSGCWSFAHYSSFNVIYTPFQKATLPPSIICSRGGSTCPDCGAQPFYFGERKVHNLTDMTMRLT